MGEDEVGHADHVGDLDTPVEKKEEKDDNESGSSRASVSGSAPD